MTKLELNSQSANWMASVQTMTSNSLSSNNQSALTSTVKDFDDFQTSQSQSRTSNKLLLNDCPSPNQGESLPQLGNNTTDSDGSGTTHNFLIDTVNSSTSPEDQLHHLSDDGIRTMKPDDGLNSPIIRYGANSNSNPHHMEPPNLSEDLNYFNRYCNFTNKTSASELGTLFPADLTPNYFNMDINSALNNSSHDSNPSTNATTTTSCSSSCSNNVSGGHITTSTLSFDNFTSCPKPTSNYRPLPDNEHPIPSYLTSFSFVDSLAPKHLESDLTSLNSNTIPDRLPFMNPMYKLPMNLSDNQRDGNFDDYTTGELGQRSGINRANHQLVGLDPNFPQNHMAPRLSSSSPVQPLLPYMKPMNHETGDGANQIKHLAWAPNPNTFNYRSHVGHPTEFNSTRRRNATKESTATLKAWLQEHIKNPYPTKGEKIMLAIITKMTLTQVSTWFANARRRLKKENKMTWTPKHRGEEAAEEDDEEEEDGDEDEGDVTQSDDEVTNMADDSTNRGGLGQGQLGKEAYHRKPFPTYDRFGPDAGDTKPGVRMPLKFEDRMHLGCRADPESMEPGSYRDSVCSPGLDGKNLTSHRKQVNLFNPDCGTDRLDKFELDANHAHTTHMNPSSLAYVPKKSWDMEAFGDFNRTFQNHFLQDTNGDASRMRRSFKDEIAEGQGKLIAVPEPKNLCPNETDWPHPDQSESTTNPFLKPDQMTLNLRSSCLNNYNLNFQPYKQDLLPFNLAQPPNPYETNLTKPVQPHCSTPHAFYNQLCGLSNPVNLLSGTYRPSISNLLIHSMEFSNPDYPKLPHPLSPTHIPPQDPLADLSYNTMTTSSTNNTNTTSNSGSSGGINTTVSSISTPSRLSSWFLPIPAKAEDIHTDLTHSDHTTLTTTTTTSPFQSSSTSSSNPTMGFNISPKCSSLGPETTSDEMGQWSSPTMSQNQFPNMNRPIDNVVKSMYDRTDEEGMLHSFYPSTYGIDYVTNGAHETQLPLSS